VTAVDAPTDLGEPERAAAPATPDTEAEQSTGWPLRLSLLGLFTISFNSTRIAGWAISDLLFVLAAFVIVLKIVAGESRDLAPAASRRSPRMVLVGTLVLLTGGTISSLLAPAPASSMLVMARFAWLTIVWFWILRSVCRSRGDLFRMVAAWRNGLIVSSIAALLGSIGVPMFATDYNYGRQAAFTFHPGELMNFLLPGLQVAIAVALVLPASPRSTRTARWSFAVAGMLSYALFTTGSTSGLVATGGGLVGMVWVAVAARMLARPTADGRRQRRRSRSPLTIMVGVLMILLGVSLLYNSNLPIRERLDLLREGDAGLESSVASRERANEDILNDLDHYLLIGLGPNLQLGATGASRPEQLMVTIQGDLHNGVHNMWLKMVYEEGIPALVGLWLILGAVTRAAYRLVLRTRGTDLHPLAIGLFGGFVAVNVSSMFGPVAFSRHFWLPIALIGCLWEVRRRELRSEPPAPARSVGSPADRPVQ